MECRLLYDGMRILTLAVSTAYSVCITEATIQPFASYYKRRILAWKKNISSLPAKARETRALLSFDSIEYHVCLVINLSSV
jgi:hypothetical protein